MEHHTKTVFLTSSLHENMWIVDSTGGHRCTDIELYQLFGSKHSACFFLLCEIAIRRDSSLEYTTVKPENGASVHSSQFYNSVSAALNCTLGSRTLVMLEKVPVLNKSQPKAQIYCTNLLHNLQFQSAATLF